MDLNNLTTNDQKELLLLHILKSNLEIVENTHSKKQETLEFKMQNSQKDFQFDEPLILSGDWMMGVTNLEVYNTVYNITEKNNKFELELSYQGIDPINKFVDEKGQLYISKTRRPQISESIHQNENICDNLSDDFYEKLREKYYPFDEKDDKETQKIKQEKYDLTRECVRNNLLQLTSFTIPPGVYEFKELSNCIQQLIQNMNEGLDLMIPGIQKIELSIEVDPISMHSILKTDIPILFNSKLNDILGFTKKEYYSGKHISEKVINISPINKIHLKCNTIDGSIVNGHKRTNTF